MDISALIQRELLAVQSAHGSADFTDIEGRITKYRAELLATHEHMLREFEAQLARGLETAVSNLRIALEKERPLTEESQRKKDEFLRGYNSGYTQISQGENISAAFISRYLPLGISDPKNAYLFGLGLGYLVGTVEKNPDMIARAPKRYLGHIDMLRGRPEYSGYLEFVLERVRRMSNAGLAGKQLENFNYFMRKALANTPTSQ